MSQRLFIIICLISLTIIGNVLYLDWQTILYKKTEVQDLKDKNLEMSRQITDLSSRLDELPVSPTNSSPSGALSLNACPQSCSDQFNSALKNYKPPVSNSAASSKQVSTKAEYVIPLGSGQTTKVGEWEDILTAQGVVDTTNYSKIKEIHFEVVMHIPSPGASEVQARLVDLNTPFVYAGEVLKTSSNTGEVLSIVIPLKPGRKTYLVQLNTSISTAILDQANIRIITN